MIGKRLFQVLRILVPDSAFCDKTITTIFEFEKFTCTVTHPRPQRQIGIYFPKSVFK